jgi:hypothetical protein
LIPVGVDPTGNFLCLSTSGEDTGTIYYWDASPDWGLSDEDQTLFPVAESIDAFLEDLQDIEDGAE